MSQKIRPRISALAYETLIPNLCVLPDPAEWHGTCHSLLKRHLRGHQPLDRVAEDLAIDVKTAAGLAALAQRPLEASPRDGKMNCMVCDDAVRPRANAIGRALWELLQQGLLARYFVRDVVLQYAARARQSAVERGAEAHEELAYASLIARFVHALGLEDLGVCFTVSGSNELGSDELNLIRDQLEVPPTLRWVIRKLRATEAAPAGTLLGVEVVQCIAKKKSEPDPAFQCALLLAEIFEPWRFSSGKRIEPPAASMS